jgi:hypothetical protein
MSTNSRLVQRLGLAIVAAGLVGGAGAYVSAGSDAEVDPVARQREMRELERLGGTATAQTVKFDQWLSSMWHGQNLAITLVVLGLVLGGACWWIGGLMGEEIEDDAT